MGTCISFTNDETIKEVSDTWRADLKIKPVLSGWFTGEQRLTKLITEFCDKYDLIEFHDVLYLRSYDRIIFLDERIATMFVLEYNGIDLEEVELPTYTRTA